MTLSKELSLELVYSAIALALDPDRLIPGGWKSSNFTTHYTTFAKEHPTPDTLSEGEPHAAAFASRYADADPGKRDAAVVYALGRVWKAKAAARNILREQLAKQYADAERAREQRVSLFVAVNRLAKGAPVDSFAAGFSANVKAVLDNAGATELALRLPVSVEFEGGAND